MRRPTTLALLLAVALAAPAAARADGGSVAPQVGGAGVTTEDGSLRFVALDVPGGTVIETLQADGTVQQWRRLRGRFGVPTAANDLSATGLTVDGTTLVLVGLTRRYMPRRTHLLVLDGRTLRLRERVTLRGAFAVDAISPYGRRLYLTHYTQPRGDVRRYEVRAYDLVRGRLSPHPIVDPREPDEKMLGIPFARAMSSGGRWAYTLYDKPNGSLFVHALDTIRSRAFCVDIDGVSDRDIGELTLVAPQHGPLRLEDAGSPIALIDRRSFAVSRPAAARPARRAEDGGGRTGVVVALGGLLVLLVAVAAARRRYVRSASFRNAS